MIAILQIVAGAVGVGGFILGVWNRLEQWRETKRKRADSLPYFTALLSDSEIDGWKTLKLAIVNPGNANFAATRVRVISPPDCWIAHNRQIVGDDPPLRSIDVDWRVYADDQPSGNKVASRTQFRCRVKQGSRPKLMVAGYIVKSGRPTFEEPIHVSLPGEKGEVSMPKT